jgi:ribosome-associated protein
MERKLDEFAHKAIQAALAKKAEGVVALDVSEVCSFARTLVICHGNSRRQVQSISEAIRRDLREAGRRAHHVEGQRAGDWVLMDYLDFVVHVFLEERRRFYALERLWGDAPRFDPETGEPLEEGGETASDARAGA